MSRKKYKLIANPAAGRGSAKRTIEHIREIFVKRGLSFDLELTGKPGDAAGLAKKACGRFDAVVVIGGDGTINETIPGMLFSETPFGIIPAGSGNDFIKSVGIPNNITKAIDVLLAGTTRVIDVGRINRTFFANGVGIGFDAAVNRTSYTIDHSRRGLVLYLSALLMTLGKYKSVPLAATINNETFRQDTFLLTIGNGTTVGGGFKLTPYARLDDGLLDITVVKPLSVPVLLWHLPKVFRGTIDRAEKYATLYRTDRLIIEADGPIPVHVDGEIYAGDETRFEIEIVPKALTVIGRFV